jgi:hypothetical protein
MDWTFILKLCGMIFAGFYCITFFLFGVGLVYTIWEDRHCHYANKVHILHDVGIACIPFIASLLSGCGAIWLFPL